MTSSESIPGLPERELPTQEITEKPPPLQNGGFFPTSTPSSPHCHREFNSSPHHFVHHPPQPHADYLKFNPELFDRDKSLTSRSRLPSSLEHNTGFPFAAGRSSTPFDGSDPRLLDPFVISRLYFEDFLRSQSEMFYQIMAEREKALSVKSESAAGTSSAAARERYDDERPESSQSETQIRYERERNRKLHDIVSGYETFGSGSSNFNSYLPRLFDASSSRDTSKETLSSRDSAANSGSSRDVEELYKNCNGKSSSIIQTSSLTELEQLVGNCIMPDEGDVEEIPSFSPPPLPPPKNIKRSSRRKIPSTDSDDPQQMLLGGVLSRPHATKFVGESAVLHMNGNHTADESESESVSSKKEHKSSLFPFKKSKAKSKDKYKKEKEREVAS